jgi:hypothetical protein
MHEELWPGMHESGHVSLGRPDKQPHMRTQVYKRERRARDKLSLAPSGTSSVMMTAQSEGINICTLSMRAQGKCPTGPDDFHHMAEVSAQAEVCQGAGRCQQLHL